MVLAGLTLRLLAMTIGHTYRFPAHDDHFSFGWETGRLAQSIANGDGFSSPFHDRTGPSAWIAPLYPYFLAGIFKILGVYSNASAWVALAINSVCSALTSIPLFLLGKEIFGSTVARWTAWIWALLPYAMYWAIRFAWETSFATLMLAIAFLIAIRLARENSFRRWLEFGVVWGVIALSNPSLLAFLPFCGLWILYRQNKSGVTMRISYAAYSALIFFAMIAPWMLRNYETFGKLVFIRGNFGAELRMGNGPNADGQWMFWLHPSTDVNEFRRYVQLGEVNYVKARQREALEWIKQNPGTFAEITLKRIFYFWFGTPRAEDSRIVFYARNALYSLSTLLAFFGLAAALKRHNPLASLFLWLFVSVPLVYYFTFTHPRYRHPIEPEMLLLMVFLFASTRSRAPELSGGSA